MTRVKLLLACALLATSNFVGGAQAQEAMGSVAAVVGTPSATGAGGSRRLEAGAAVYVGDTINSGQDSNAQLILDDGTKLVVGPSSRLVLQTYLRKNSGSANKVAVKALRGTFRFITGKSAKPAYRINTVNATIGVRGTGLDFTVGSTTVAAVMSGEIWMNGQNGQHVTAAAGCGVAEAGGGNTAARELEGTEKSDVLNNQLPYVTDQSDLEQPFYLPVNNCLAFLGSNSGGGSGVSAGAVAAGAAAISIPAIVVLTDEDDDPISPDGYNGGQGGICTAGNCD